MIHLYEHPSGVFLNVTYVPATAQRVKQIQDVRVTDVNYQSVGPDIGPMLHNTHVIDTTGPVTMATPLLQLISEDITHG